jgi:pyrroline-5-carboxylate reductase
LLGLIGSGNMARALARGWAEPVLATDAGSGRARRLVEEVGGEALASNAEVAQRAGAVVLAHKPYQLEAVAEEVAPHTEYVISVLGGVSLDQLRAAYPGATVVRAMPNTPVEIRQGVTILAEGEGAEDVRPLFERVGHVFIVPERLLQTATATTGVTPAYVALLLEAHVDAAIKHGLPEGLATDLAMETFAGSMALLRARGGDTLRVRREVTSPGGSTARGLSALEDGGVRGALMEAMKRVVQP